MTISTAPNPIEFCEAAIHRHRSYNIENQVLPPAVQVADRLLARRIELTSAYTELHAKLASHDQAPYVFFDVLLGTSAFWNPKRIAEARAGRERLREVNAEIALKATALAKLVKERDELHNSSGFSSNTHYHPMEIIEAAAAQNYLFCSFIKKKLLEVRCQFDFKYWPEIHDCVLELARDAGAASVEATDRLTKVATRSPRSALADYFKALFAAIDDNSAQNRGFLPRNFSLTDASLASLATCALDLGADQIVDAPYVKRMRQRERERERG